MLKKIFNLILIIGISAIFFFVYNILANPWKQIPSMIIYGVSNPLWLRLFVVISFFYIIFLSFLFNKLQKIFNN